MERDFRERKNIYREMKLSLKIQDTHQQQQSHQQNHLLLRAKIPITVFGLPFLSGFATADPPSDLFLSIRTNFSAGPSLKLSYTPSSAAASPLPPLTLTLKSGVSLYGSPNNSPLIISAHFSFSPLNPNSPNPTFSLQFKPRLGDFSLRKSTFSDPNPNPSPKPSGDFNSIGFLPLERPRVWKDLAMESPDKDSIFSGILVMANTKMPVAKRMAVNLRWGVNFPADFGKKMPFLSVNKIGIERVDEVKEVKGVKEMSSEGNMSDSEMLKGMLSWMRRELDVLQRENREMKHNLEEMKLVNSKRNYDGGKKPVPIVENLSGFEQWRSKKSGGEEIGKKESCKVVNSMSDVESELQRAILASSST